MAAGIAQLEALRQAGVYERLEALASQFTAGIAAAARAAGVPLYSTRVGSMFTAFFTAGPVTDEASAKRSDTQAFATYFQRMLERGVYFAPSQFEAGFVSLAHSEDDIAQTIAVAQQAFAAVAEHSTQQL
jgi:glutamate-1-semialdehyde 2,1-aminomutase